MILSAERANTKPLRWTHLYPWPYKIPTGKILRNIKSQSKIIKPTNNKVLLYSTGNYIQHLVVSHNGKEYEKEYQFSSVQSLSRVRLFATTWIAARQASLSITNSRSSLKLMSIESVMPSSHLILCHPLLLLAPIPPSIRVFSNESALCMRWPKYWNFSFSIISSKEHPGLISFRMDWLALLAVQGTLKSLLQHHSSKASILRCSACLTNTNNVNTSYPL